MDFAVDSSFLFDVAIIHFPQNMQAAEQVYPCIIEFFSQHDAIWLSTHQ